LNPSGTDELSDLGRAFDAMTQRLQETTVSALALQQEVEQHKRTEQALHETQARLQSHAADLEKTVARRTTKLQESIEELEQFSYAIVHDLRAPLRAMQGFAALLEEECSSDDRSPLAKEYLRRIRNASRRMDQLIIDALSYSKSALDDLPLGPVDLQSILDDLLDTYPNLQRDRVDIAVENRLPMVYGNEAALTQCLSNLLGNAVKFAKPGVPPRIRLWSEKIEDPLSSSPLNGTAVRLWVEDNGIGIPVEQHQRIFRMFQRATAEHEGTGIGLAIVRKAVQRMGGEVGLESELGKGSRFWVVLKHPR
jgi:signal transduction histidine kinase